MFQQLTTTFLPTVVSEAAESDIEVQTALIIASWSDAILDQPPECTAIHPAADILTPERITRCLNSGYAVNAWRVQTNQRAKNLIHNGATGLIVDDWAHTNPGRILVTFCNQLRRLNCSDRR